MGEIKSERDTARREGERMGQGEGLKVPGRLEGAPLLREEDTKAWHTGNLT